MFLQKDSPKYSLDTPFPPPIEAHPVEEGVDAVVHGGSCPEKFL